MQRAEIRKEGRKDGDRMKATAIVTRVSMPVDEKVGEEHNSHWHGLDRECSLPVARVHSSRLPTLDAPQSDTVVQYSYSARGHVTAGRVPTR